MQNRKSPSSSVVDILAPKYLFNCHYLFNAVTWNSFAFGHYSKAWQRVRGLCLSLPLGHLCSGLCTDLELLHICLSEMHADGLQVVWDQQKQRNASAWNAHKHHNLVKLSQNLIDFKIVIPKQESLQIPTLLFSCHGKMTSKFGKMRIFICNAHLGGLWEKGIFLLHLGRGKITLRVEGESEGFLSGFPRERQGGGGGDLGPDQRVLMGGHASAHPAECRSWKTSGNFSLFAVLCLPWRLMSSMWHVALTRDSHRDGLNDGRTYRSLPLVICEACPWEWSWKPPHP